MRARTRVLAGAIVLVLLVALAALAPAHPDAARASFTDRQEARGGFATATLQSPAFDSCTNATGDVAVSWHFTSSAVPAVAAANVYWSVSPGILSSLTNLITPGSVTTTGPDQAGAFTTTIAAGVIGGLVTVSPFTIQAETRFQSWTALGAHSAQGTSVGIGTAGYYSCAVQ